jgi:phospholipase/carboxylesterase
MRYTKNETSDSVVLAPAAAATASVIWLHGLGADGNDFVPIVPELQLPESLPVRFVFPHAAMRAVTINSGYVMRAWYDIKGVALSAAEDEVGIRESENRVRDYIQRELAAGIAANKIVIAGFSQGGAIALQTALRYPQRLAGVMALSTYLPLRSTLATEVSRENRDVPILMCHGRQDPVVPMQLGAASRDALNTLGFAVEWQEYAMEHSVCMEEIVQIGQWLRSRLG